MGKLRTAFVCQQCGMTATKWLGRCPDCDSWNSFAEEAVEAVDKADGAAAAAPRFSAAGKPLPYDQVPTEGALRTTSGLEEFDRVLAVGEFADEITGSARRLGFDCGCVAAVRDIETAQLLLDCWLEPGDVILVKGSRGMRMERIVNYLRGRAEQDGREESSAFNKVA